MRAARARQARRRAGFTLIELLLALSIGALLVASLGAAVHQALATWSVTRERSDRVQQARFALDRMVAAVRSSERLLIPFPERASTAYSESVRNVLAVLLDPTLDRDRDGFADADSDRDGRVDEDLPEDVTNDNAAGIVGIDDDGDGVVDEGNSKDDDEDEDDDEDWLDGVDNDGDGLIDEDPPADVNNDSAAGILGTDDDGDGFTDESGSDDDDEDEDDRGTLDEDWYDPVVFYLVGGNLIERLPNPHPASGNAFTESVLAESVSELRVERLPMLASERAQLVEIKLTLASADAEPFSLTARVRLGSAR